MVCHVDTSLCHLIVCTTITFAGSLMVQYTYVWWSMLMSHMSSLVENMFTSHNAHATLHSLTVWLLFLFYTDIDIGLNFIATQVQISLIIQTMVIALRAAIRWHFILLFLFYTNIGTGWVSSSSQDRRNQQSPETGVIATKANTFSYLFSTLSVALLSSTSLFCTDYYFFYILT